MSRGPARGRRLTAIAALVVLGLLAGATAAAAHASLIDTDPTEGAVLSTAPRRATLTFNEPVRLPAGAVRLFDADGHELATRARSVDNTVVVALPAQLDDGTYVLSWRVISADSHPVAGTLQFSIGAPSAQVAPVPQRRSGAGVLVVQGIAQGLLYLGLFASIGLALFTVLLLPSGSGLQRLRRRLRGAAVAAGAVAVLAAVVLLPITAAYLQGLDLAALATARAWRVGVTSPSVQVALLVTAGVVVATAALTADPITERRRRVVLGATVAALLSLALVGHTRSYGPPALVLASDAAHVLAGTVWFGGLLGLAIGAPTLARRPADAAVTLTRFSTAAAATVGVLVVAGTLLGWRILGSWAALVHTPFGALLLAKIGLVALTVAVAGWNRYRLLPRLAGGTNTTGTPGSAGTTENAVGAADPLRSLLHRTIRVEAGVLVAVLLLTGFLVDRSPEPAPAGTRDQEQTRAQAQRQAQQPEPEPGREWVATTVVDDIRIRVHVQPLTVGRNVLTVRLEDRAGNPFDPYAEPVIALRSARSGLDLGRQPVTRIGPGTYRVEVIIPTPATWLVSVSVRTGKFTNPVAVLKFPVRG